MRTFLKLIYLLSSVIYLSSQTDCGGLSEEECIGDCIYTPASQGQCPEGCKLKTGKNNECESSIECGYISGQVSCNDGCSLDEETEECEKDEPESVVTCTKTTGAPSCNDTQCEVSGVETCTPTNVCNYQPGNEASCNSAAVEKIVFTSITLKLISVSGNNVVISITPDNNNEKDYKTTAKATINGLSLVDSGSFNQQLTCEISSGYKLSSSVCTIEIAASDGNKYKLSGTPTITSSGADDFGNNINIESDIEITATTINDDEDDYSFYLNYSFFIFSFLFLL
jgi:hypothetical protein